MGWFRDNIVEPLIEGFSGDRSAQRVRDTMVSDKERAAEQVRRSQYTRGDGASQAWSMFDSAGYAGLADHLVVENDLMTRFFDYEEMDDFPELHTALDIYADDATQEDSMRNRSIWVTSENAQVREIANELLHQTLRIEEDLWGIARTLAKYGNQYAEVLLAEGKGVVGLAFMPPATVRRVEEADGTLLGFMQDLSGKGVTPEDFKKLLDEKGRLNKAMASQEEQAARVAAAGSAAVPFEGWEVIHWRTRGKWMRSMYGHSVLESARWVWRRLVLLEDAAMLYKLTRAPARYAYYIDTGDLNPKQALAYVSDIKRNHKKKKYVNAQGKLEFKVNPLAQDEDFWVPTRGGKESTRIEVLSGADWQSMEDLKYFRQKLLAAIKIPAQYIGMSDQGDDARASLSSQDVRFARTIMRLQREMKAGVRKILRVHLSAVGIDPNSIEWDVHMAVPSSIFELAQVEVRNAQADLAARMEPFVSKDWLMTNVFDFAADEAKMMRSAQKDDSEESAIRDAKTQAKANKILGIEPMPMEPEADDGEEEDAALSGETSKEVGTGNTAPSPNKGKQESSEARLAALVAKSRKSGVLNESQRAKVRR
jgi:hypothetical protein